MHLLKLLLRCINAVRWVKNRHEPICIHKMEAILSVNTTMSYIFIYIMHADPHSVGRLQNVAKQIILHNIETM